MDPELTDDPREIQRILPEVATRECPPALVRSVLDGEDTDRDLVRRATHRPEVAG